VINASDELTRRIVFPYVGDTETLVDEHVSNLVNGRTGFLSVSSGITEVVIPINTATISSINDDIMLNISDVYVVCVRRLFELICPIVL
jgi:hypothetical protein